MNPLTWFLTRSAKKMNVPPVELPPKRSTPGDNAIEPEWHSGWTPDDSGFVETRQHVGRSAEGFHGGVERCVRVCEPIVWGDAHTTPEGARKAAEELETNGSGREPLSNNAGSAGQSEA